MSDSSLKEHATSDHDFYELLGVEFETSENDIKRAYRKTSLKYHPDKNPGNVDKFHLIGIARDVLLDPEAKAAYDKVRAAKKHRERQNDLFAGKRRKMKEDLERRESGFLKRKRDELNEEEELERQVRRLAEDGKKRRLEREERLKKEREQEVEKPSVAEQEPKREENGHHNGQAQQQQTTDEQEQEEYRTVIIRWYREGKGERMDADTLSDYLSRFGQSERAFLKSKEKKVKTDTGKKMQATAFITFKTKFQAQTAIAQAQKVFPFIESMDWAKKPDLPQQPPPATDASRPTTPAAAPGTPLFQKSWRPTPNKNGSTLGSPAFSFSPLQPKMSESTTNSPSGSLQESTMMRLKAKAAEKAAEKKRLEEQIRQEEAAE